MKIPKKVKELPWPEDFHGGKEHFKLHFHYPVVEGERLLVIDFMANRDFVPPFYWSSTGNGKDFRLVCWKRRSRAAVLYRGENQGRRNTLGAAMKKTRNMSPRYCYPWIERLEEARLGKWLGKTESTNHCMPELECWVDRAVEAELQQQRDGRGELRDEDVELCPAELPEGFIDHIRRHVLPKDKILLYKKGNVRGLCYCCGEKVRAAHGQRFRQNEMGTCPECGEKVLGTLEGGASYYAEFVRDIATLQLGKDGKTVFIRMYHIRRDETAQWQEIEPHLEEFERWAIRGNRVAKWRRERKYGYFTISVRERLGYWERIGSIVDSGAHWGYGFYCPENWRELLQGTSLQYCDWEGYRENNLYHDGSFQPIRFFVDWVRYPAMEKFWKAGYTGLVRERLRGFAGKGINWRSETIPQAVGFPLRLLRLKRPGEWTAGAIARMRDLAAELKKGTLRERELEDALTLGLPLSELAPALRYATVHKIAKYMAAQRDLWRARNETAPPMEWHMVGSHDYRDYLRHCEKLELELSDRQVLFPPDLYAAHQRTLARVRYKVGEPEQERFQRATAKLVKLAYAAGGLLIRPASSPQELIDEGAALNHCVASYANQMGMGITAIFFVRREAAPDTPFYTLELKDKRVIQCRTNNNANYEGDAEVLAFVEDWMAKKVLKTKKKAAGAV